MIRDDIKAAQIAAMKGASAGVTLTGSQFANSLTWTIKWIVSKQTPADNMLEEGELAEITVDLSGLTTPLGANTAFNLEIKPPTGAVLNINRTTPAAIQAVMDLN